MKEELAFLLLRYMDRVSTPVEDDRLFSLLEQEDSALVLMDLMAAEEPARDYQVKQWQPIVEAILLRSRMPPVRLRRHYIGWAATLLMILSAVAFLWIRQPSPPPVLASITAGTHKAMLTLSDGTTIQLDSVEDRTIDEGIYQQGGQLLYERQARISFNTLSTPRGGQFRIQLPDGTKVWLNAASSLKYPTSFSGKERKVEVSGEAYFEVVANTARPFKVIVNNDAVIEVLGTSFNVYAYKDENMLTTTLVDGAVRVTEAGGVCVLKPGQQSRDAVVTDADVAQAVAWKNDIFDFNDVSLEAALRQISRWYDIDVVYEGKIPQITFIGKMGRDVSLSKILEFLRESHVRCRMEQRTLIIKGE